jgi:dolichol-phosphate mannosyltransferase
METEMSALSGVPSQPPGLARPAPDLSIIIPTFSERDNVPILVNLLRDALAECAWEVIFVDDNSPDGTAAAVRAIGEQDDRVRCIQRIGRRGLAGACLEGMLASAASYLAVMDADLQHDETRLVPMLALMRAGNVDLVVASRYMAGGSAESFSPQRSRISRWSSALIRFLFASQLSDPLSGFFMLRRETAVELAPSLSSQGFKILLDIVATARGRLRVAEVPSVFRKRLHGRSKLDSRVALDFIGLTLAKLTRDAVSLRLLLFCLVGLTGVAVHVAVLDVCLKFSDLSFISSQAVATIVAIAWNFVMNNRLTYRDQRLSGWAFLIGLLQFEAICSVGAISNVGVASWLFAEDPDWRIAGIGGALIGAVWNYALSAALVWRIR